MAPEVPNTCEQFSGGALNVEGVLLELETPPTRIRSLESGAAMSVAEVGAVRVAWKSLNALSRIRARWSAANNPNQGA